MGKPPYPPYGKPDGHRTPSS